MAYNPIAYGAFISKLRPAKRLGGRRRWKDSRHDELERYDRWGHHNGVVDPETGERIKPGIPGRRTAT